MKNRFNGLQLADTEPGELWSDIRDIVTETADKRVPKAKRKKVTKWLSDEAVKIADERRDVRSKGDDKEYRRLNAVFQRRARQDKEQSIKEKCRQIGETNRMGRTRRPIQRNQRDVRNLQFKKWSHKAEHGEGGSGKEGGERNMAAIRTRKNYRRGPNTTVSFNENI